MSADISYTYFPESTDTSPSEASAVLLLYQGGTIGAVPSDRHDPTSPLTAAGWQEFDSGVPQLQMLRNRGIRIDAVALDQPLDSSNVGPKHWRTIVEIIGAQYARYMGFVILHGTDTMVYTASALSFMLTGLDKPVVITGSQVPILGHPNTDGIRNLVNAIIVAAWKLTALPRVGEVCIAFDKVLLRGNRSRKVSADSFAGFVSPNFPPLGTLEERISIDSSLLWRNPPRSFRPRGALDPNVLSFQIFPGIQNSDLLDQLLGNPRLRGVVLQAYGVGNAPTDSAFLDTIGTAVQNGKIVIDVTQCPSGSVRLGQYETGVGLLMRGVLSGSDLTPEAALCKLMALLARDEMEGSVERYLQRSLAGEQSESTYTSHFLKDSTGYWEMSTETPRVDLTRSAHDTAWYPTRRVSSAWLHLHDARIEAEEAAEFDVYFQIEAGVEPRPGQEGFAASARRSSTAEPSLISIDVTPGAVALAPALPPRVSMILRNPALVTFDSATLVVAIDERKPG